MRYQSTVVGLVALMSLAACDQISALVPSVEEVQVAPTLPDLVAETKARGLIAYAGGTEGVRIPSGFAHRLEGEDWLTISGALDQPKSSGKTNGVSFEMPAGLEEQVSGKRINIHIVTSADAEGEAFLAYSTNEVGNSGWMSFPVTTADSVATLQYRVREMREGRGDFIGIDPNGRSLTIKAIVVEIAREG